MQNKKVCIISKFLYENDTRLQQQAKTLKSANFDVDVLCLCGNHCNFKVVEGINVHGVIKPVAKDTIIKYLWSTLKFGIASFLKLQQLSFRKKYDLIVVHTLPESLIFTSLIQKLRGTKVLLDVRDTSVELFDSKWGNGKRKLLKKLVRISSDISCNYADKIITASPGFEEKLIERNVPKHKISIIYNSADTSIFKFYKEREYKKITSGVKIVYHGTIAERFGIDIAIESIAILQSKIPNSEFHIFGFYEDEYKAKLQILISKLKLENLVFLNGRESLQNLYNFIKKSDIGIVPYRNDEFMQLALSTKMFEYVASGLPVVAARLKPAEFILNDKCILYASPDKPEEFASNIEKLCLNPELRKSMVENAYAAHSKISGSIMSKLYVDIVNNLITQK